MNFWLNLCVSFFIVGLLLEDHSRRAKFQSIPTKLELPQEDIEMLIDVAPELLHKNPEFDHLLKDLDALVVD